MPAATPHDKAPASPSILARLKRWFGARAPAAPAAGGSDAAATTGTAPAAPAWPTLGARPDRPLPQMNDYALEHVIARSDRSTIYRATDRASGRLIALKTVRLGEVSADDRGLYRERFLRESAAAARLKHENIVRVHAGGVSGTGEALTGWLAMEWVQGTDLSQYATPSRLLPERLVLTIAGRVALALDYAHRAGIVHRDIKPANVLYDPSSGAVKVTDFGSARIADAQTTRSGVTIGTPAYMAPEMLAGVTATAQCDLYALGVLLFELLTGRRPFESESMGELLKRIARVEAPRLRSIRPDLPQLLDDIVARLLAKRPEDRHAGARRLAIELRMAEALCETAAPEGPAWADTQPLDAPEAQPPRPAAPLAPGEPVPHNGVHAGTGRPSIRGTIGDPASSAERRPRRTLPSS
jgi:serine/threonine-protein kinase